MAFTAEELFQSIDKIVTQRLSDLSFDTTVIATIIDDSKKAQGHYVVSDGSIKFDAYTNDTNYKVDDQVIVTVLNGDWSQKKFISDKYIEDEANGEAVHYIAPLGTTVGVTPRPLQTISSWSLKSNGAYVQTDPVVIHVSEDDTTLQVDGVYNVITLSADIETDMGDVGNVASGNYGILVDFVLQPAQGTTVHRFFTFDSDEMIGNPYSFAIQSHQEKKIIIPTVGLVKEIHVSAYQGIKYDDDGNFETAPFKDKFDTKIDQYDIHFSNITIAFGSDLLNIEDNSLKLYTLDSSTYQWNQGDGANCVKRLGFIWYNKDDNHEYVGFSDGVADATYDEIAYLKEKDADARLVAQQGKEVPDDEAGLRLAANAQDLEDLMRKTYRVITTDLHQVLLRLEDQIVGATSILEELNPFLHTYKVGNKDTEAKLSVAGADAKSATDNLRDLYKAVLKYGYCIQNQVELDESQAWDKIWVNTDSYDKFCDTVNTVKSEVDSFLSFMEQKTRATETLSGYRPFYNDYKPKINAQIALINSYMDQMPAMKHEINGVERTDLQLLAEYKDKTEYTSYLPPEDYWDKYKNRYCVYWYRYVPGYALSYMVPLTETEWAKDRGPHATYNDYLAYCEANNLEQKYAHFLGNEWERIKKNENTPLVNYGLPRVVAGEVNLPASADEQILLTRKLDPVTENESYRVVMFYNHEMIKSNVLTFTNTEADLIPPQAKIDSGDVLRIEHHTDSRDHYQAYSSAYDLLNIRDGSLYRQIKCFYDGVLSGDEAMAGAEIYWYVPTNATMLTYDLADLKDRGFNTDAELEEPTSYSKAGYVYFNKKIQYEETKEDILDNENKPIYKDDGTKQQKSVIKIEDADRYFFYKIKTFYEQGAQNNTILVEVHVPSKGEPTKGEITFTFGTFGTNGTKYTLAVVPATTQIAALPSDTSGALNLKATLYNADNEIVEMDTSFDAKHYSLKTEWYAKSKNAPSPTLTAIEASKSWSIGVSGVTAQNYNENKYIGIVKASVTYEPEDESKEREISLSTLYPVAFSSNPNYYISGPTAIIYNSQGIVSRVSEEPYCLYTHVSNGNDHKVAGQKWSLEYYDAKGNLAPTEVDGATKRSLLDYMPTLNSDNTVQPAPMYYDYGYDTNDNLKVFYIPVAVCRVGSDIVWTQPIAIIQNRYESSMLNDWDGSLDINEANGTIMSTMVGAGKKNEDNSFSGVLMGDIVAGANFDTNNTSGLGIYGIHHGAQSFNLSIDGTAFIGKSGRGRISFDGNNGFIYSGSWWNSFEEGSERFTNSGHLNQGRDGLAIDLQNGHIDAYNFKLTSNNIYLNSNPGDNDYYIRIGNDDDQRKDPYNTPIPPTRGYLSLNKNGDLNIRANSLSITGQSGGVNMLKQTSPKRTIPLKTLKKVKTVTGQETITNAETGEEETRDVYSYTYSDLRDLTKHDMNPVIKDDTPLLDWDVANPSTYAIYSVLCASKLYMPITYEEEKDFNADPRTKYLPSGSSYTAATTYAENTTYYIKGTTPMSEEDWNKTIKSAWSMPVAGSYENKSYSEANARYNKYFYLSVVDSAAVELSQTISEDLQSNEYYTVSGYVNSLKDSSANLTITYTLGNGSDVIIPLWAIDKNKDIAFKKSKWTRFEHTFLLPEIESDTTLTVTFKSTCSCALWHTKLEHGSIATGWSAAPGDSEDSTVAQQEQYDTYLSQDKIFDKLVTDDNGQKMVGIWLLPGEESASGHNELYINATYMSTGILRSNNFDGTLTKRATSKKDAYGRTIYTYDIGTMPTQGVYFNLNEGKLWAANFELVAGNTIRIDSSGNSGSYFKVASGGYYLDFKSDKSLAIKVTNFDLEAGSGDTQIWFTSNTSKSPLKVGKDFSVTWAGLLTAANANITGTINATTLNASSGGKIGGWIIDGNRLYSAHGEMHGANGTLTFGGGSSSGGAQGDYYFHVSNDGHVSATGATLTTLTVSGSATFTDSCQTKILGNLGINTDPVADYDAIFNGKIYAKSNIVMGAGQKLWCDTTHTNGVRTYISFATNGMFCYGNLFSLNCDYIQFTGGQTFTVNRRTQLWKPEEVFLYCPGAAGADAENYVTLAQYIKNNSGDWFNISFGTDKVAIANVAKALGSSSSNITMQVPDKGSAGQFLKLTNANGTTEWSDLYAPTTKGTDGQVWTSTGSGGAWESIPAAPTWSDLSGRPAGYTGTVRRVYSVAKGSADGTIKYRYSNLVFTDGILTSYGTLDWTDDINLYSST